MVSDPDSKSRLALDVKQGKDFNCQFTDNLEKCDFFANDSKNRHIIYRWKAFFTMSMNSKLLPQNKVSFDSDLLA